MSEKIPPDPQDDAHSGDADLVRALDAWRLSEEGAPLHPSEISPAEHKETLAELLAQFGQEGLEPAAPDAPVEEPAPEREPPAPPAPAPADAGAPEAAPAPAAPARAPEEPKPADPEGDPAGRKLGWLRRRSEELSQLGAKAGRGVENLLRQRGEWYNKQKTLDKIVLGAALTGIFTVSALGAAASLPYAATVAALAGGAIGLQRLVGIIGIYDKLEKHQVKTYEGNREGFFAGKKSYQWFAALPEKRRKACTLGIALLYTAAVGTVLGEAVHLAAGEEVIGALGHLLGHIDPHAEHLVQEARADLAPAAPSESVHLPPGAATPQAHFAPEVSTGQAAAAAGAHLTADAPAHAPVLHMSAAAEAAARDHLETEALNQWQLDHGGTPDTAAAIPPHDYIESYIRAHMPRGAEHHALHAVRARLGLSNPPAPEASAPAAEAAGAPFHTGEAQIPQDIPYHAAPPQASIPEVPAATPYHVPAAAEAASAAYAPVPGEAATAPPAPLEHPAPAAQENLNPPFHQAESSSAHPISNPILALEQGQPFTNPHDILVEPAHPAAYGYSHNGQRVVFVSGGGTGESGFQSRMDFIQKRVALDKRFWGMKIYFDASESGQNGASIPDVGQFVIDKNGVVNIGQPTVWDTLFSRKMPLPDPHDFDQRYDIKS
ncbi:MAG TPA: hypothetical protein VHC68_00435 [Candidatus Paceibacterota bacterium]|nr:hypothetical protein [Candidatus Paceibacterota bacterium]